MEEAWELISEGSMPNSLFTSLTSGKLNWIAQL